MLTEAFEELDDVFVMLAEMLRPPERLSVSQAATKYRHLDNPGAYTGPWLNSSVPYLVEPMNVFVSPEYKGEIFVGPAQSGKTDALILNTALYSIKIDPMDTMVVCPTNSAARDFSMRRIDRLHRHSPEVGAMMLGTKDADNKFDKLYKTGMMLSISWPTVTELAGKPIPRVIITDRDRMPDDIDGDGEPFDLASKRTTTFGSNAMCLAESSPSREVTNPRWIASTLHEAPPCGGIVGLYNRGDRRRWYWPCPSCGNFFEGRFEMIQYDRKKGRSNMENADTARMHCPHCDCPIHQDERYEMNLMGVWLKDGEAIDADWKVIGTTPRSRIASFWLRGVAAAFVTWKELVTMYLDALDHFEKTGDEGGLIKFYNNDMGEPYYSKRNDNLRLPEVLKGRAEKLPGRMVPHGVRFLVATIDSQKNMWVVMVTGVLPGAPFDTVLIDRFEVRKSKRVDDDGDIAWVKPATYLEDWDEITEHVLQKTYQLADGSGRHMRLRMTGCDSGGKAGVTTMAYNYYRKLMGRNEHRNFVLLKGDGKPGQPRTRVSYPDSSRKDAKAGARGDVPVLMINSNLVKDDLDARLESIEPGKGMYRTPDWLDNDFYQEMCAEIRTTDKGWIHEGHGRNENWDLSYYTIALCISPFVRADVIDWANPPGWAAEWDRNDLVSTPEKDSDPTNHVKSENQFAQLAAQMG